MILAMITDDARGLTSEHITYSDFDTERLNALPDTIIHRNVDIPVVEADKAGYVRTYIIIPSKYFSAAAPSSPQDS